MDQMNYFKRMNSLINLNVNTISGIAIARTVALVLCLVLDFILRFFYFIIFLITNIKKQTNRFLDFH